jgi:UDP-N-acetylmuramate dehydrogenase
VADTRAFAGDMSARFREHFRADVPLSPLTTFKVGGPADWLVETRTSDEIVEALRFAHLHGVPVTLLGGGSNVLVGDRGVRGLVIRTRGGRIESTDATRLRADAATTINGLVRWTIHRGIAGVERWAGTPGTVGGAIYGNAHFGGRLIGELVESVRIAGRDGTMRDRSQKEMEFGYDRSRLQVSGEVLLSAVFRISTGDPSELREGRGSRLPIGRRRSRSRRLVQGASSRIRSQRSFRPTSHRRQARSSIARA